MTDVTYDPDALTGSIQVADDLVAAAAELKTLRAEQSELRKRADNVRQRLLQTIAGNGAQEAVSAAGTPVARITVTHRTTIDRTKLEALYPDVFADVAAETPSMTVDILI